MKNWTINCDMGEGMPNDQAIMPLINECNIACGGHTGDVDSMIKTVKLALKYNILIGAHPSFPDREHFGRRFMQMHPEELIKSLAMQVDSLLVVCEEHGTTISHIKPHGALYNNACKDESLAEVIVEMMKAYPGTTLFAPWQSTLALKARKARLKIKYEAFADRKYKNDRSLVRRSDSLSVITRVEVAMSQVLSILQHDQVVTMEKEVIDLKANTICVHSDNPNVVEILKMLKKMQE